MKQQIGLRNFDVKTLADLIVSVARADTTKPAFAGDRNGWLTDILLNRILDPYTQRKNDPEAYLKMCEEALNKIVVLPENLPEALALIGLGILRGVLCLPQSSTRDAQFLGQLNGVNHAISVLPEGARRQRCRSLFLYYKGIFCDSTGRFAEAAANQLESARFADSYGDEQGAAIGRFMAAVFSLKCALKTENPADGFAGLLVRYEQLTVALRNAPLEVQWAKGNAPMFMLQASVWLDVFPPQWDAWVANAFYAAEKMGENSWISFIRGINQYKNADPRFRQTLREVVKSKDVPERKAAALLLLARHALIIAHKDEAAKFVRQMPTEQSAQHVVAVAKRLIARS